MSIDYAFLEVSYNPAYESMQEVTDRLSLYGFTLRTKHSSKQLFMCNQNRCIIFVRETDDVELKCITGLGFICAYQHIANLNPTYDHQTEMYYLTDPSGLRIILVSDEMFSDNEAKYDIINNSKTPNCGLTNISGVRITSFVTDVDLLEFYLGLGFKLTKRTETAITLVSNNNSFTIVVDKRDNQGITTVVCETQDVFSTTSKMLVRDIEFGDIENRHFIDDSIDYKVRGYQCISRGSLNSYCIEKFAPNFLTNTDMLVRMRKNYVHLLPASLDTYYV